MRRQLPGTVLITKSGVQRGVDSDDARRLEVKNNARCGVSRPEVPGNRADRLCGPTVDLVATGHRRGLRVSQAPSLGPPAVKSVEMRDGGARGRRLRLSMQEVR